MPIKKPELLSPAGNLEKLQTAVRFGANAVYVGAGPYSLRAQPTSFDIPQLKKGIKFAHKHGVKVYLAMNIFAFDNDLVGMKKYLNKAIPLGIDAVIISDVGLLSMLKNKKIKIHLSTQTNTLNTEAVKFWQKQGVKRIVLGREITLKQAKNIKKAVPNMELELFVHGAMCMSYSGRCFLSKYMTGRSANRGECTHPCRWEYFLKEKQRPDEEFSIEQDQRGTYLMNSKDLCMIEHIPELIDAGIDSFKIEGRMKTPYYVALVTKIYRQALDTYYKNSKKYKYDQKWAQELKKISYRGYTTGFYLGNDEREDIKSGSPAREYDFVGVVLKHDLSKKELEIAGRNAFGIGDDLEIVDPKMPGIKKLKISSMRTLDGKNIQKAHNNYHVFAKIVADGKISNDSLIRKKR